MAAILHDSLESGSGHFRRAQQLGSLLKPSFPHLQLISIPGGVGGIQHALERLPEKPSFVIFDTYRPLGRLVQAFRSSGIATLQLVDFEGQEAVGDWILDPFSIVPINSHRSSRLFQGLEYAVFSRPVRDRVSELGGEKRDQKKCTIFVGASTTIPHLSEIVDILRGYGFQIRLFTSNGGHFNDFENLEVLPMMSRNLFWDMCFADSDFLITNCGVTALERISVELPGMSIETELNQSGSARALENAGAFVIRSDTRDIRSLIQTAVTAKEKIASEVSIGSLAADVVTQFTIAYSGKK